MKHRAFAHSLPCTELCALSHRDGGRDRNEAASTPPSGDFGDLPEPLILNPGVELPSAALERLRRDER
jgi:hypothetical protein